MRRPTILIGLFIQVGSPDLKKGARKVILLIGDGHGLRPPAAGLDLPVEFFLYCGHNGMMAKILGSSTLTRYRIPVARHIVGEQNLFSVGTEAWMHACNTGKIV